ncbi:hypothetical protein K458DRAFT_419983 [Lentithecium fluviatile CBS 122367]|uniref:Uncharacterized protein n=1 Tax=Lentithecium fluviatile CBS 122367 TaxID=1168545 RepID=A0A6G1IUV8_9PLEO|nr:hypothetical protein K458DRAFT_419983 [Lentithecium fluviatile CBS 122367]
MVVQVIESRYTVDFDVLTAHLKSIYDPEPFEVIPPDEGEKWKIKVPRELTRDQLIDLQRKFKKALKAA